MKEGQEGQEGQEGPEGPVGLKNAPGGSVVLALQQRTAGADQVGQPITLLREVLA
jgi:hypothetical protein